MWSVSLSLCSQNKVGADDRIVAKNDEGAYQIYDSLGEYKNLIRVLPEKLFYDPTGVVSVFMGATILTTLIFCSRSYL